MCDKSRPSAIILFYFNFEIIRYVFTLIKLIIQIALFRYNSDPSPNEVKEWIPDANIDGISRTASTSSLYKNVSHPTSPPPPPPPQKVDEHFNLNVEKINL